MVFPKEGLPSPITSPSEFSHYSGMSTPQTPSTCSTVKTGRASRRMKRQAQRRVQIESPESSPPATPQTTEAYYETDAFTDLNDEALIRKLITEGLWSHNKDKLEIVLNKIGNLMFTADEKLKTKRRDAIFRAGGHLAIVQAMRRNPRSKGVQTQGCRALANATWETSDFMEAIAGVGGVEAILSAMTEFMKDEVVQICGACALRNLTSLKKIAKTVVEEDGFAVVVAAMRHFPMNANIQECGCWTIAHICMNKVNKPYIEGTRCFGTIGDAGDNHPKQPEVQKAARKASERLWAVMQT